MKSPEEIRDTHIDISGLLLAALLCAGAVVMAKAALETALVMPRVEIEATR